MNIAGISAYYHDSAAALIIKGEIVAAAQEERFSRKKHDSSFPVNALKYCLGEAGLSIEKLDAIAFYDKPFLKFERLLETYLAEAPNGFIPFISAIPVWLKEKLFLKHTIAKEIQNIADITKKEIYDRLLFSEHHQAHAASAFFPSPFDKAAILTIDGVGEWSTTSLAYGRGNEMQILKEIHFPHSLGLLYSAFTYFTGFKVNSGEYKLMGLAPYGEPKYVDIIMKNLVDIKQDGSFRLNMDYFNYTTGLTMTNDNFNQLFGGKPRDPENKLTQREMDIAASIQKVTEQIVLKLAKHIKEITGAAKLCLAGGVALNCVANGMLLREKIFDDIWIQPAAGDAGGALGAAYCAHHIEYGHERIVTYPDKMKGCLLGPEYSETKVKNTLDSLGAVYKKYDNFDDIINFAAEAISRGDVVGWHQGRMEFGPRALGNRSILGDPRDPEMQKKMNLKIKFRESFRPFAPSVLMLNLTDYFELKRPSPYMLFVADVNKSLRKSVEKSKENLSGPEKLALLRSEIPAVTHVDYSARIQTVHKDLNPKYYALIRKFREITGYGVIVNTSFNVRGEPIVCTPEDSFRCFMNTDMDVLVIENFLLVKEEQQDHTNMKKWKKIFEAD